MNPNNQPRNEKTSLGIEQLESRVMLTTIQVLMAGQTNEEIVQVRADDQVVAEFQNIGGDALEGNFVSYNFELPDSPEKLRLEFVNDLVDGDLDRNVRIESVTVDGRRFAADAPGVFSTGTWTPEDGCDSGFKESQWLHCGGYLEFIIEDSDTASRPITGSFGSTEVDHIWRSISLGNLENPVIIAGPPSGEDVSPGVVQVRGVSSSGFDLRFKEWNYLDFVHGNEPIDWMALGEGRYTTADGSKWEVGKFDLSGINRWSNIRFAEQFNTTPNLFLTIQTQNGAPVLVRARNLDNASFDAAFYEEQAQQFTGHGVETVGYLAIESAANSGVINIGGTDVPYLFERGPIGTDVGRLAGQGVQLQEEQSFDSETAHAIESVNALSLGRRFFAQIVESNGLDPVTLRSSSVVEPRTLPDGFVIEEVVTDEAFLFPVGVQSDLSGQQYFADQRGYIWLITNGQRQDVPFLDLTEEVSNVNFGAGQMTGFTLDPDYLSNGYIYVLYTTTVDGESFGRLTRFTRDANDPNTIDKSTALNLIGQSSADGFLAADFHSLGDLEFGEDGTLLVSWGDSASNDRVDPAHFNSQNLDIPAGKIFRINSRTGRGFATNPYFDGDYSSLRSKIWATGLRNGFRFAIQPGSGSTSLEDGNPGRILIGDVGRDRFEELNIVNRGDNLGWPYYEGNVPFRDGAGDTQFVFPAAAFAHPTARSVTGGVFLEGQNIPAQFRDRYLIADFVEGWIKLFEPREDGSVLESEFATGVRGIVDMVYDPISGDILIAGYGEGVFIPDGGGLSGLYRLRYTG